MSELNIYQEDRETTSSPLFAKEYNSGFKLPLKGGGVYVLNNFEYQIYQAGVEAGRKEIYGLLQCLSRVFKWATGWKKGD